MDTSELLKLGARSLVVNLCKQLEEVTKLVPELQKFARMLAHESLGGKPMGPRGAYKKTLNGDSKAKLADQLVEARAKRFHERAVKANAARKPMTQAMRDALGKRTKKRWAEAKRLGISVPPGSSPSKAMIAAAKAAQTNVTGKAGNGLVVPSPK